MPILGCERIIESGAAVNLLGAELSGQGAGGFRIALVDDEPGIHQFLTAVVRRRSQGWAIDSYVDAEEALSKIPATCPDAVVMDLAMPRLGGIDCLRRLGAIRPGIPVVIYSAFVDSEALVNALMEGAYGVIFKPATAEEILGVLHKILGRTLAFCPRSEKLLREHFLARGSNCKLGSLTNRERDVLRGFREQKTDKEIAEALHISVSTVHVHTAKIFKKLNVHTRREAVDEFFGAGQAHMPTAVPLIPHRQ